MFSNHKLFPIACFCPPDDIATQYPAVNLKLEAHVNAELVARANPKNLTLSDTERMLRETNAELGMGWTDKQITEMSGFATVAYPGG